MENEAVKLMVDAAAGILAITLLYIGVFLHTRGRSQTHTANSLPSRNTVSTSPLNRPRK